MPGRGKEHWHQGCSTVKENIMCEAIYHFPLKPYKNIYFSVRGYLPLILKDSITHMHGERRTSFCVGLISRKLQILTYVFNWLYFIFLY